MAPEVLEVLRLWVRKAEHDLEAARRIMAVDEGCPYDMVCFHCQQSAEKYLKALLTRSGLQAPRTHDLDEIYAILPVDMRPFVNPGNLNSLTPYAVSIRYSDDWRETSRQDAVWAFDVAWAIRAEARLLLGTEALAGC